MPVSCIGCMPGAPARLIPQASSILQSHVAHITLEGNNWLSSMVASDPAILSSSPTRIIADWPAPPAQTSSSPSSSLNSSPLSSPPSHLDHNLERLGRIERSVADKVVLPDKAQRMGFALEEYTRQNDQK